MALENSRYIELRRGLRQWLKDRGVPSNPAVSDAWVVAKVRETRGLPDIDLDLGDMVEGDPFAEFVLSLGAVLKPGLDSTGS